MLSFNEYKIEGQWVQLKDKGIIANKDFWSPPSPSPPIRLILQKSENFKSNSEWQETVRN